MYDVIIAGGGPAGPLDRDTIAAVVADRELLWAELERATSAT